MKKVLIAILVLLLVLGGALVWLAGSVGPDTAPTQTQSIELDTRYDQ